ncbi:pheromone a factor receptor [Colletotrichum spaethianum]|uniref:Pheromone a factor receptor n=1 Tax=Colletotrichum spaethianum TaxID=700344 RepID=A0AA37P7G8_9PEZI|nr:pheromone a factor receptor [Colletotrichum spaethianum]GKT43834.1 pheromone a factor receptor [Colletotrichum spaethianum]
MAAIASTVIARTSPLVPNPPLAPYTNPYLQANLVCRVVLALAANAGCWVPLRNLCRQGELAPAVLVGTVIVANCLTIANALIWRDDNVYEWWDGQVWCDVHAYVYQPLMPLFWLSVVAITRNLAQQMDLSRASPLSGREKRRKTLVQALIMFPLPIIQTGLLYPISSQRFRIATLTGCMWSSHPSWPFVVFFLAPRLLAVLVSVYYAVLTWRRYSSIAQATRSALMSNSSAATRAGRTRWRLFFVMVCVIVPYSPLDCYMAVVQFRTNFLSYGFDFNKIRQQANPYPWDTILLLPSDSLSFFELNHQYFVIATALPIFYFFGMTEDAKRTYRRVTRTLGLGRVFPWLREGPASGRVEQQLGVSLQKDTDLTLMKSTDGSSQYVRVSHVSRTHDSASSPPPSYKEGLDSPAEDMRSPSIAWDDNSFLRPTWHYQAASRPSPRPLARPSNPSAPPCYNTKTFLDERPAIAPPAATHVRIRSWLSEGHGQLEQTTRVARLPRLTPLPDPAAMVQAQQ